MPHVRFNYHVLLIASLVATACLDQTLQPPHEEVMPVRDSCIPPGPDELPGWEPDESCPNLAAIVGEEAVEAFERDRARRDGQPATVATDAQSSWVPYAVTKRTVHGYVRDGHGQPLAGLRVQAMDADLDDDDFMGEATTSSTGYFEIHYDGGHWDPCPHEWTCWRPDIYVVVSSRQWINHGPLYAGNWDGLRPKCSNLDYAWQIVAGSPEHTDWRHDDPLRIDVQTAARDEIWDEYHEKPACLGDTFCYEFISVHNECFAFVERHQGCTVQGQQFEWFSACLFASADASGVTPGVYGSYDRGHQSMCFAEPLPWPPAACTDGASLQPVDPQPSFLTTTAVD